MQVYHPHTNEIRSIRFSNDSSYLLTASYDKRVVMTNLNGRKIFIYNSSSNLYYLGDLTKPLVLSTVAAHNDKIIQARW